MGSHDATAQPGQSRAWGQPLRQILNSATLELGTRHFNSTRPHSTTANHFARFSTRPHSSMGPATSTELDHSRPRGQPLRQILNSATLKHGTFPATQLGHSRPRGQPLRQTLNTATLKHGTSHFNSTRPLSTTASHFARHSTRPHSTMGFAI